MRTTLAPYTTTVDTATDPRASLMWQRVTPKAMQSWSKARDYCDDLTLGGHDDWHLPSRLELLTLVDYRPRLEELVDSPEPAISFGEPLIDRIAFANTPPSAFWTASTFVEDDSIFSSAWPGDDVAWTVDFGSGLVAQQHVDLLLPRTRCVRDARAPGTSAAGARYVLTSDTVTETATGLIWERSLFRGTYQDAEKHCASLVLGGSAGFRLPHVKEAMTLASGLTAARPCIDPSAFKVTTDAYFYDKLWTATPSWTLGNDDDVDIFTGEQRMTVDISARGRISPRGLTAAAGATRPPTEAALCVRDKSAPRAPASLEEQP